MFRGFTQLFLCSSTRCTPPVWRQSPRILFRAAEKRAHDNVQRTWELERVLGVKRAQFAMSHAIRTSNHEINVALTLRTALAPHTIGATVGVCHKALHCTQFFQRFHALRTHSGTNSSLSPQHMRSIKFCQTEGDRPQLFGRAI